VPYPAKFFNILKLYLKMSFQQAGAHGAGGEKSPQIGWPEQSN
jgi:hypothetical protein